MEMFYQTDCETLWGQIKHKEKQFQLKRRWLLGIPLSESEQNQFEDDGLDFLPESLLRDDDMFYDTVKSAVQAAYKVEGRNHVFQDDIVMLDRKSISTALSSCLDDLTTKGLHLIATTITRGSVKFEKTRWQMKKIIRESLQNKFDDESGVFEKLSKHLSNPENFRDKFVTVMSSASQSHRRAVRKVLDRLEDLPYEALLAMYRKLEGGEEHVPRLEIKKCRRINLIAKLRKTCKKLLSEPGTGDELQGSLTEVMAVAGLSLKLQPGIYNYTIPEFHLFSQEVKMLQDDIASAIWLVSSKSKVSITELEYLKNLLDRDAKVSKRSLRIAIKKMLTEYFFLCGYTDTIPESLSKTVNFINKKSPKKLQRPILKDEIDEEVECILNVSAQTKQIVWNMFPHHEVDIDFADAYVEEMEDEDDDEYDSDDDDNHNQGSPQEQKTSESGRSHSDDSHYDDESIGDSRPFTSNQPTATTTKSDCNPADNSSLFIEELEILFSNQRISGDPGPFTSNLRTATNTKSDCIPADNGSVFVEELETLFSSQQISGDSNGIKRGFHGTSTEGHEPEHKTGKDTQEQFPIEPDDVHKQTTCNKYLAIQKVCDETSMIAHDLVGHMLEEFAQIEGLDLDLDDTSYFNGDYATPEDSAGRRQRSSQENKGGSVIVNVIEELIPSFPKSEIEALRNLVGK